MSGFAAAEYQARLDRAQDMMGAAGLGALLLTTEPEIRYFTGFLTRFWESPSRPWFLVVPASGQPVAVIPSIGRALMEKTGLHDIRCWSSPDMEDDGVSLLAATLREVAPEGLIGAPSGQETHLRMPLADFGRLCAMVGVDRMAEDAGIMRRLRMVKSEAEIAAIRTACDVAGRAFARVGEIAGAGVPLSQVFRDFQRLCLEEGADWVPYLAGGAGPLGYDDVISPATDAPLDHGDVLMLDTGLVVGGYFCDFDRNFAVGVPAPQVEAAWDRLLQATEAGLKAAMPGARACDVFAAMDAIVGGGDAGRLGHGLGMQLTEWPSLMAGDRTELQSGMVLTLEPGIAVPGGGILVHEENIVLRDSGAAFLSPRALGPLPRI
ncbi:MAG: M24 family metallopeptidase [Alphaproteobacteria bacterium]|jgi:Xaa-Pro aminopeptidase|nr:M24 family metallopeptidase [Alphaproteobacteria bacterium]